MHWNEINSDLKHIFKHIFRGGATVICQKYNSQMNENFEKWPNLGNQIRSLQ